MTSALQGLLDEVDDQQADIENRAMRILAQSEQTRRQLRGKLLKKGFASEAVDSVLEQLVAQNLLSDQRYAEQYVALRSRKGYGPVRIAQELRDRGVSETLADEALAAHQQQWVALLDQTLQKKFGKQPVLNFNERARQARFLEYRGFPSHLIRQRLFNDD